MILPYFPDYRLAQPEWLLGLLLLCLLLLCSVMMIILVVASYLR